MIRPKVSVYKPDGTTSSEIDMPAVFSAPLRSDLVRFVADNMRLNRRQPYAVKRGAGMRPAAHSWGPGRGMARVSRVHGSGTRRGGQGAWSNMCRGGRMFAPTKVYRRWHRKTNHTLRQQALAASIAASGIADLCLARGHRVQHVPELPLVLDSSVESLTRTRDAVALLRLFGLEAELERVAASRKVRAGRGKLRNRRYKQRRGPLIVYGADEGIVRAFRNIRGIDLCSIARISLIEFAPGGVAGRMVIWTEGALKSLAARPWAIARAVIRETDIHKIFASDAVATASVREQTLPIIAAPRRNLLKSMRARMSINPAAKDMGALYRAKPTSKLPPRPSRAGILHYEDAKANFADPDALSAEEEYSQESSPPPGSSASD